MTKKWQNCCELMTEFLKIKKIYEELPKELREVEERKEGGKERDDRLYKFIEVEVDKIVEIERIVEVEVPVDRII